MNSLSGKSRSYSTQTLSENHKYWLGGFVEGEGSLVVSIVTNPKVKHGIVLPFTYFYNKLIDYSYLLPLFRVCFYAGMYNFFISDSDSSCSDQKSDDKNSKPQPSRTQYQECDLNNYKPIKSYIDAKENKKAILKDFKGKSGVYCWTNRNSGRKYVGSAKDFSIRLREYYNIKTLQTKKSRIHSALLALGHENFLLEILVICDNPLEKLTKEQEYIDSILPSLNILNFAGSSEGHTHSLETKEKMRIAALNRSSKVKNHLLARLQSQEWKEENLLHLQKLNSSEKHIKHITALGKAKGHPVTVLHLENGLKTTYSSNVEASKALGCNDMTIIRAKRKLASGEKNVLIKGKYQLISNE